MSATVEHLSMEPEPFTCGLDPATGATLTAYLVTDVQDTAGVRARAGEGRVAAVRARLVCSPLQLAAAANSAALAHSKGTLRTRSEAAETVYNLSLSRGIAQSLATFGPGAEPEPLVLLFLRGGPAEHAPLLAAAGGARRPMALLPSLIDWPAVTELYKLDHLKEGSDPLDVILTRMATKSFVSY